MFFCISSSTRLSHPGLAFSGLFLHTNQTEDASAADDSARVLFPISVWIGQLPSTTNPARTMPATSASHASGLLLANTTTIRPSGTRARSQHPKARNIPFSYAALDKLFSPLNRL